MTAANRISDNDIVLCSTFSTLAEAQMASNILAENGIVSTLDNALFGSSIYPIGLTSLGGIRLMVFHRDLSTARSLLTHIEL